MTDVLTPEQRSHCMSRIRGRNTRPEVLVRKKLWSQGIRYRLGNNVTGRPDIVFPRQRLVVFIDGCFWHRCPLHYKAPATRHEFWEAKIAGNVERDSVVNSLLMHNGWTVLRFWEHEVNNELDRVLRVIRDRLTVPVQMRARA